MPATACDHACNRAQSSVHSYFAAGAAAPPRPRERTAMQRRATAHVGFPNLAAAAVLGAP